MRKSKLRRWCVAVTLWSAWALSLAVLWVQPDQLLAQEKAKETCVFEGTARNSVTHVGIGRVSIHLLPLGGSVGYNGASDGMGSFHFEGVVPGDYELFADHAGYSSGWILSDSS